MRTRSFNTQIAAATIVVALLSLAMLVGYGGWATLRVDAEAETRERTLVGRAILEAHERLRKDQLSTTIWTEAVVRTLDGDQQWISENIAMWVHEFYGVDSVLVLDPAGNPIHAVIDGRTVEAEAAFPALADLRPYVRNAMAAIAAASDEALAETVTQDVATILGGPSIVSIAPLVPENDSYILPRGQEPLHVAVRRLDRGLLGELGANSLIHDLHFSAAGPEGAATAELPLVGSREGTVGYAAWDMDRPGRRLIASAAPGLAAGGAASLALLFYLNLRLRRAATSLQTSEAQARRLAVHDPLTGLPNRALFDDRLDRALAAAAQDGTVVALHYVDLDRFKNINDTLGHAAGDEVIRTIAARFAVEVRDIDTVARLGGDEFAVIQPGLSGAGAGDAEALAARLLAVASEPCSLLSEEAAVGASIGVALAPSDAHQRAELMRKADIALYEAKADGKGRVRLFSGELEESVLRKRAIEQDLRQALDSGAGLRMVYQPLFAPDGRTMLGAEALVRWTHPRHGDISPTLFIPVAEERGLIRRLGAWALERACSEAVGLSLPWVSVNVAPQQLREVSFAGEVLDILRRTGLPASRLQLEVTESGLIGPTETVSATLRRLRRAGIAIALDDFGTGFSSLHYLRDYQVDKIKIDRSFVQRVAASDDPPEPIIRAMVELGRSLGLRVVAEGVETEAQWSALAAFGCQELQGFHFARPCEAVDLALWSPPIRAAG